MWIEIYDQFELFLLRRIDNDDVDSNGNRSLQHSPEVIADTFTTQPSINLSLMHSNYVAHFQCIDDVVNATDILSHSDIVLNEWRVSLRLLWICYAGYSEIAFLLFRSPIYYQRWQWQWPNEELWCLMSIRWQVDGCQSEVPNMLPKSECSSGNNLVLIHLWNFNFAQDLRLRKGV